METDGQLNGFQSSIMHDSTVPIAYCCEIKIYSHQIILDSTTKNGHIPKNPHPIITSVIRKTQ